MLEAAVKQQCSCHYVASELTHMHVLISWRSDRAWEIVRKQLGWNATHTLNQRIKKRQWFAKSPSRKRVNDRRHFDYLTSTYLPRHSGLKWNPSSGVFR
jgi:hypothetical protein